MGVQLMRGPAKCTGAALVPTLLSGLMNVLGLLDCGQLAVEDPSSHVLFSLYFVTAGFMKAVSALVWLDTIGSARAFELGMVLLS